MPNYYMKLLFIISRCSRLAFCIQPLDSKVESNLRFFEMHPDRSKPFFLRHTVGAGSSSFNRIFGRGVPAFLRDSEKDDLLGAIGNMSKPNSLLGTSAFGDTPRHLRCMATVGELKAFKLMMDTEMWSGSSQAGGCSEHASRVSSVRDLCFFYVCVLLSALLFARCV